METYIHIHTDETKQETVKVLGPFSNHRDLVAAVREEMAKTDGVVYASEYRADGVCDFCSEPNPSGYFKFDAHNQVLGSVIIDDVNHIHTDTGEWAACGTCRDLISAGDIRGLLMRSVDAMMAAFPQLPRALALMSVNSVQSAFWKNYDGSDFNPFPTIDDVLGGQNA